MRELSCHKPAVPASVRVSVRVSVRGSASFRVRVSPALVHSIEGLIEIAGEHAGCQKQLRGSIDTDEDRQAEARMSPTEAKILPATFSCWPPLFVAKLSVLGR